MRAKFPSQVTDRILEAAKKEYSFQINHAELGRRLFTRKHCGTRMVQVKVFLQGRQQPAILGKQ